MNPVSGKIAIGMSGGTDSSVAAALLVEQGYEVLGVTARMWKEGSRCCSLEAVESARKVCRHLDIRHLVINVLEDFTEHVAERFAQEYIEGRTPSPCVNCNQFIKFGTLLTRVVSFGCDALATGHYARRVDTADGSHLLQGRDTTRDQSYFLHRLSQRQLSHALFPLGEMLKQDDVIPYAREHDLPIALSEESRDICFAPPGQHHAVVERFFPDAANRPGDIVTAQEEVVGRHEGIHRYTVGQRRGLGLSGGPPLYVIRIDAEQNRVVVGARDEATAPGCVIEATRWIAATPPPKERDYTVSIRYQHGPVPATLTPLADDRAVIRFDSPQFGVAPGQAAVVYCGAEVMGGGWIAQATV